LSNNETIMGLTRLRASQISDIDYKQAVRTVTATNVTLSGGAPAVVDGVSLSLNNRVLVAAQTDASQNGIYTVTTAGSGSNGIWTRSADTNATGELLSGTIVMVTEGTTYADTQWKLITNDPIAIGVTALTFVQNYTTGAISAGTSNVVVINNADVVISSAGTANVLTVSNVGIVVVGTTSVTGNIQSGNLRTAGQVSATGNIQSGNLRTAGQVSATGNIQSGNLRTAGQVSATGVVTGSALSVGVGNVTAGNLIISGAIIDSSQLDIQTSAGNANIVFTPNGTGNVNIGRMSATGDITSAGNIAALNFNSTFADLAEMYSADAAYAPGVVVSFGGSNEITLSGNVDPCVAGVVSTNPSYTMNTAIEATHVVTVALTGRVPTRVTGSISKGDLMISATGGRAQAWVGNVTQPYPIPGTVFGKALSNHGGGEGVIEVVIGRY
jgi:hypothetical protein